MNPQGPVVLVTDDNYNDVVTNAQLPVILAIGAPWCPDCVRLQPFFMQFAQLYADRMTFASCDYDNNPQMKEKFQVRHIPTIVLIKNGVVVDTLVEPKTLAPFKEFIEKALA